jgi:hypothetical protein
MILKNLKHGEVRPGDILIWTTDLKNGAFMNSDLVVSVNVTGEFVYFWSLELSTLKLWSSQSAYKVTPLDPYVFRVEP